MTVQVAATILQELHLSPLPEARGLRWRRVAADSTMCDDHGDAAPVLRAGETLRLDTYLNCFYERYWRDLTRLTSFGVEIVASGSCRIRLVRSCKDRTFETLQQVKSAGARTVTTLTVPTNTDGGILHVEVEALSDHVEMHAGHWTAAGSPANPVALVIVICSYGHEAMVAATLESIAGIVMRLEPVHRVLVVHQGANDLEHHPSMRPLLVDKRLGDKLKIVRQGNFGGSGGFARGMMEAQASGATHVLLMDDDIRLLPSVLLRLTVLLSHLKEPTILGGQMLNLEDPTVLHASHERVDLDMAALVNPCQNSDVRSPETFRWFQDLQVSDYSAWWFCCIPVEVIQDVGLPLPIFIRHDDIEYGLRSIRAGWRLVAMPGLFVWHEAFAAKYKPWNAYYDRRNILVCTALHGRIPALRFAGRFAREASIGLAIGRYDYCWALCRAVNDYLAGPDIVFSDPSSLHQALLEEIGRYMLRAIQDRRRRRVVACGPVGTMPPQRLARLIPGLVTSLAARDASARLRRRLALSVAGLSIRLWLQGGRAAKVYRAQAHEHTTGAFWARHLGLRPRTLL